MVSTKRLLNTTFKGVAGTEVTSDLILLKKNDTIREVEKPWYKLDTDENGLTYNRYFVDNPHMICGEMKHVSGRFGNTLTCIEKEYESLKYMLDKAILGIEDSIDEIIREDTNKSEILSATDYVKNFSFTVVDEKIYYREDSQMIPHDFSKKDSDKLRDYIGLNKALREGIRLQKEDYSDEEIKIAQDNLNNVYDNFSKK